MSLYLHAQFLEVLYYRTVDCTTKIGVLIRDDTSFVADAIIYILIVQLRKWVVGCGTTPTGQEAEGLRT